MLQVISEGLRICFIQPPSPVILSPLHRRAVRWGKGCLSTAGDTVAHRKVGSGDCKKSTISGVLFQAVSGPEGERPVETDHRPESPQSIHFTTEIQDGNGKIDPSVYSTGRICSQSRPGRRILSRPYPESVTEISQVCLPRHSLSVPGPTLWPQYQSLGFYQGYGLRRHLVPLDFIYRDGSVRHSPETYGKFYSTQRQKRSSLLDHLGFLVNWGKSDLRPSQRFVHLGMEFLTDLNLVRLPRV